MPWWLFISKPLRSELRSIHPKHTLSKIKTPYFIKNKDTLHMPSYVYDFFLWNQSLRLLNFWFTWTRP
jgi:hypothetical protein